MILLFFSVWAIAIALSEVLFASQPFSLNSIMSTLPQTMIFSALLSAAVYLAKSKILDAMHKGRPIDKKFVAEITPEVGHELNKMRQKIASYDENETGNWRDDPASQDGEFKGEEYAQAQKLFAKFSAAAAQGQLDPNDPEFKALLAKAKESGLDIQDLVAIAADQSIPVFPDLNLPDEKDANQTQANPDLPNGYESSNTNQTNSGELLDSASIEAKEKNISELVDKYRSQGNTQTEDPMASLDRLAAAPELNTNGLTKDAPASAPLTLQPSEIQPIRSINIQERERQQSLEQSRLQQRRNAQLEALAEVASAEDQLISQFRAAAAEGNQLAKAQIQMNQANQAVSPANANIIGQVNRLTYPNSNGTKTATITKATVAQGETGTAISGSTAASNAAKTRLQQSAPSQQTSTIKSENMVELASEAQDQVLNVVELSDRGTQDKHKQSSNSKTNGDFHLHIKSSVDNPSLVDTSNLKKYQYVPPKKGAGLDTSALKKVTLPNYNRHGGPSRLGSANKLNATPFRPAKSKVASTASLSAEERQELMAKLRKGGNAIDKARFSTNGTTGVNGANGERRYGATGAAGAPDSAMGAAVGAGANTIGAGASAAGNSQGNVGSWNANLEQIRKSSQQRPHTKPHGLGTNQRGLSTVNKSADFVIKSGSGSDGSS